MRRAAPDPARTASRRALLAGAVGATAGSVAAPACAGAPARSADDNPEGGMAVQVKLEAEKHAWRVGETVTVRLVALNDSYEPVTLDRRLLVGPSPAAPPMPGLPALVSMEPAAPRKEQNEILLNPWCLYGRERTYDQFPAGQVTIHGYLLRRQESALLPQGPRDQDALLAAAEPLVLTIESGG